MKYYEKLKEITAEIDNLKNNEEGHKSIEFTTWHRKVNRFLKVVFGENSEEFKDFESIPFRTLVWGMDAEENSRYDFEAYQEGLNKMNAILNSYTEEIAEIEIENNQLIQSQNEHPESINKANRIFISHSSKDKKYIELLVDLLEYIGLDESNILCTSVPGFGIPLSKNIFEYLREEFLNTNLHIIFLHSKNYYDSTVCLNEMGAAWLAKSKYTSILLPGFGFKDMKGVVSSQEIAIKIDGDIVETKSRLNQFYEEIVKDFNLPKKSLSRWEQKRDDFIESVSRILDNPFSINLYTDIVHFFDDMNDIERKGILVSLSADDFREKLINFGFVVPKEHIQKLKVELINRYKIKFNTKL